MSEVQLDINDSGKGAFFIDEEGQRVGEMVIGIAANNLTVYHTEVSEKLKGQGVSTRLLATMVEYARAHNLKVIPLCPYVSAQFKRHPEQYEDVWNRSWHKT